jgi:RNA polymerase sigma factor (sigma-70 family)
VPLPPFQAVLDEHRHAVHRYLVAAVGPHDAADCFQEAMISALRAYPSLRDGSNLRGWLFTIAHHKVIDASRARARRPVPVAAVPDGRAPDPGDDAGGGDDDLWASVRRLPPKQRTAVLLRFLDDRPYRDIATVIGCSEAAARQNVSTGLAALREGFTR